MLEKSMCHTPLQKETAAKYINIQNASHSGTAPDRLFKSFGLAGCGDVHAVAQELSCATG